MAEAPGEGKENDFHPTIALLFMKFLCDPTQKKEEKRSRGLKGEMEHMKIISQVSRVVGASGMERFGLCSLFVITTPSSDPSF